MSFYTIFFLSIFIILPIKVYPINSISKDINIISSGLELYKKKCSNCHGINAQGKSNGFFLSPNLTAEPAESVIDDPVWICIVDIT